MEFTKAAEAAAPAPDGDDRYEKAFISEAEFANAPPPPVPPPVPPVPPAPPRYTDTCRDCQESGGKGDLVTDLFSPGQWKKKKEG